MQDLQNRAAANVVITRQLLLDRQLGLLDRAEADAEYAAANTALKQLATLAGFYTEKQQQEIRLPEMTQEQRDACVSAALRADT